jgi:hypothetical protein
LFIVSIYFLNRKDEEFYQSSGIGADLADLDLNSINSTSASTTGSIYAGSGVSKINKQVVYKQLAQRVILSSMGNVNLVHEIIRNVIINSNLT